MCFYDADPDDGDDFNPDAGDLLYDPSYEHSDGQSRNGFTSLQGYEEHAVLKLLYVKVKVVGQPVIDTTTHRVDLTKLNVEPQGAPDSETWDCVDGQQETYLYVLPLQP